MKYNALIVDLDTAFYEKDSSHINLSIVNWVVEFLGSTGANVHIIFFCRYDEDRYRDKILNELKAQIDDEINMEKVHLFMPRTSRESGKVLQADFIDFVTTEIKMFLQEAFRIDLAISGEARLLAACRDYGVDTLLFKKGRKYVPRW